MKASRERQERFMRSFGNGRDEIAKEAVEMIRQHGPSWLTDEQMDQIVSHTVSSWRFTQRINIRNRKRRIAS